MTVEEASERTISFLKDCLGIDSDANILCDESFFGWIGHNKGSGDLEGLLGTRVHLYTTWCLRLKMKGDYNSAVTKTPEMLFALNTVENRLCLCNHLFVGGLIDPETCYERALETSDHKPFFLASLSPIFYRRIQKAQPVPIISVQRGRAFVLHPTAAQIRLFKTAKTNRLEENFALREITELKLTVDSLEIERDFYIAKLGELKTLCQSTDISNLPAIVAITSILDAALEDASTVEEAQAMPQKRKNIINLDASIVKEALSDRKKAKMENPLSGPSAMTAKPLPTINLSEYEQQITELKLTVDSLEEERYSYFAKLGELKALCQSPDISNMPIIVAIKRILDAAEEYGDVAF